MARNEQFPAAVVRRAHPRPHRLSARRRQCVAPRHRAQGDQAFPQSSEARCGQKGRPQT
jgi:hypothetical protein